MTWWRVIVVFQLYGENFDNIPLVGYEGSETQDEIPTGILDLWMGWTFSQSDSEWFWSASQGCLRSFFLKF
ncbi:MAG: hypothetical protein Ta2E_09600 [Mycoplasmoidaceae bacterium]|nr:MAG: hypothetical protein Ta2E_09600 [Mycoplasmoidaceae bacterium]